MKEIEYRRVEELTLLEDNPRKISVEQMERLKESIDKNPDYFECRPVILSDRTGELVVIAGNQRVKAATAIGMEEVPTILLSGLTEEREKEIIIRDNVNNGEWDEELLADWDASLLDDWGVDISALSDENFSSTGEEKSKGSLKERMGIIPFSILDSRKGDWQERKREWLSMGIRSEIGRKENLTYSKSFQFPQQFEIRNKLQEERGEAVKMEEVIEYCKQHGIKTSSGTSIFDPVLCEFMYRFFCTDNGVIVDPFAGGSVRGIVASVLGYEYKGCDLRKEQVEENINNANEILTDVRKRPMWVCGDSTYIDEHYKGVEADMIFTCPPYADLEVYSDDPRDISNMDYENFLKAYRTIIQKAVSLLKENRFAVFVVGEVRDKKGYYYNFVGDTIKACIDAGLIYYNEIILVTQIGTKALTMERGFNTSRKVGKIHQNVLVFYKRGGVNKINDEFKPIQIPKIEEEESV